MFSDDTRGAAAAALDPRRTWFLGGVLLLVSHVVTAGLEPGGFLLGISNTLGTVLFAAALVVFALGFSAAGSVTARRPLGTGALVALAVWSLVDLVLDLAGAIPGDIALDVLVTFGYIDTAVQFALAVVAAVQIARAGVVPKPWNWAPAVVVAALTVSWLLQFILQGVMQNGEPAVYLLLSIDSVVRIGGTIFLGVLAIVLATHANRAPIGAPATREPSAR
ncbi:hypothetical protein [Mycetocola manganoxydans]|nr:hypothetical protein [Mycetocola manganoxydans]GHD41890.1 hypothetical protein GCM10008097_07200 [Mycetocola manganoxydans]